MLKAIHAAEDIVAARQKAVQVIEKLRGLRLTRAAEIVETAVEETLAYYAFCELGRRHLVHSFVRPPNGSFFCPGLRSRRRRAQGRSRLAAFAAAARLGFDRPKHGGTLAHGLHSSPAWNLPSVATMVVGRGRPRGEAWRVGCKRHRTALACLAELRRPRAGFWPPRLPLCHEALVTALRLGGKQHLAVSQRLDVIGIG
jgi:hypothetical protein